MKKVLVVDNLKAFLTERERLLSNRNLTVFTAASGEEALAVHKAEKVDLVITALDMPGMRGDALCSLIRRDAGLKNVSVLIICNNSKSDLARCRNCGANAFITKPLDPLRFLDKVNSLVNIPGRTGMRVLIKVAVKGDLRSQPFFCSSVNISTSGILLETERAIEKGAAVNCSFFVPGSRSITVDCEVVRVVNFSPTLYHCGVKFLNLHPDHASAIEEFVRKKASSKRGIRADSGRRPT